MSQSKYDLIYILDPGTTAEENASIAAKVEQITTAASGTVVKKEEWGRRRLAYRVGRHREGVYVFFQITVDTKTIDEVSRNLRLIEKVIKYQVVKEVVSHRKPKPPRKKASRPPGMENVNRSNYRPSPRPSSPTPAPAPAPAPAPVAPPPVESAPSTDAPAS